VELSDVAKWFIRDRTSESGTVWAGEIGGGKKSTKLGTRCDFDGLYLLLAGSAAVLSTTATLPFVRTNPFPRPNGICG
ncbi:MAG: hypothetical protein ABI947_21765, partial [Chloroflexota bacterium]